jgi:hypothetical protein
MLLLLLACKPAPTEPIDPQSDADGDGLTQLEEELGWTISVNTTGYAEDTITRLVSSDPAQADSDGDGLDDQEEMWVRSDPMSADTDGDGLSDFDEVMRWGTSPGHVDSDADSRGSDPDFPAPPLSSLFDGAELALEDGIPGKGATSPSLSDSDGDGLSDYDELQSVSRSATVAEMPTFSMNLSPDSTIDLSLDVVYSSSNGTTTSHSTSLWKDQGRESGESSLVAWEASIDFSTTYSSTQSINAGCCTDIGGGSVSVTASATSNQRASANETMGVSEGAWRESTTEYKGFQERSSSEGFTVDGARIQVLVDLQNTSNRAYSLSDYSLLVYTYDQDSLLPLGTLRPEFDAVTLGPGESVDQVILSTGGADPAAVAAAMANPKSIILRSGSYAMADAEGEDFDYQFEEVFDATSRLTLDFGEDEVLNTDVASSVDRDDYGDYAGVLLKTALENLELDWNYQTHTSPYSGESEQLLEIDGRPTIVWDEDAAPWEGLDLAGYPESGGPGLRYMAAGWVGFVQRYDSETLTTYEDMLEVPLYPGDQFTLVYTQDKDRDGISAREETLNGCLDGQIDSDAQEDGTGDGLSDFWELREGWMVTLEGEEPYRAFSSPAHLDLDGDGLADDLELSWGTDPNRADTDGDGKNDNVDPYPLDRSL